MSKTNVKKETKKVTHEGMKAKKMTPYEALRRSVLSCMLFENTFYEDGEEISERILNLVQKIDSVKVSELAIEAREKFYLRHVPLLLCVALAKIEKKPIGLLRDTVERVIQRPDEITELLSIYWKYNTPKNQLKNEHYDFEKIRNAPIANQIKTGIKRAFKKFDEYQLAKYNRKNAEVWIRDVMFLTHPKPSDENQEDLFKRVANDNLNTPDTWEVALSRGDDKKETFERLLSEKKLGYMALLRNLRNMEEANVDFDLMKSALIEGTNKAKILPFRFISAYNNVDYSGLKYAIDEAMLNTLSNRERMSGKTCILVDVSGSMTWGLSGKSQVNRMDVACGLGILAREVFSDCLVYSFSNDTKKVKESHGISLLENIKKSQWSGGTDLNKAIGDINKKYKDKLDRLIVITDEQAGYSRHLTDPIFNRNYMINVAPYKNGIGYGNKWIHIDGFSEATIDFIVEYEKEKDL